MSIIDRILGRTESRASLSLENPNTSIGDTIVDNIFNSEVSVNEATVLSIPAVKRAVSVLSSTIAGLPVSVGQKQKGGFIQKDDSHELSYLLNYEPNEVNDKVKFFEVMITNLLIHGNAFAIINRDKSFKVTSLDILHPDLVTIKVLKNGSVRYEQDLVNNKKKSYKPYEVIHLQGQSSNGFIGFSNLDLHKETFELALQIIKFGKSYYENGGFMSGIIKHPASLSDNAHKRLKSSLTRYSGASKAGKQLILDEGMSYETLTINPSQAGFVEVNQYLIGEFSRIFGVPPFILSDLSKSTMQNVESLTLSFVKHTVIEHLNRLESELSRKLLTEAEKISGYCINFNLDELLKADSRTRGDYIKNLFNVGALTINEVRLMEGLAPLDSDEADKTYIQINMGSVQDKELIKDQQEQTDKK